MTTGLLASFWYYRRFDFSKIADSVPLILDSGAYSAFTSGGSVDRADYIRWLELMAGRYDFAFNLDVMGDHDASFRSWADLRDRGFETVPVIHYGTRADVALPAYLEAGASRLSMGGIVVSGAGLQVRAWIAHVFRWLRDNGHGDVPVHGLGLHMRSGLAAFPWATTDSSAFTGAWRYARMQLWDKRPGHERWHTIVLDGKGVYQHVPAIAAYGVRPQDVDRPTPEKRENVVRLCTRMEAEAAQAWDRRRARHAVPSTTRYLVEGSHDHFQHAADEVDRYLATANETILEQTGDALGSR